MLPRLPEARTELRPLRHWKTLAAAEAVRLIRPGATIGVGWLGDATAEAMRLAFQRHGSPHDITVVYATADDAGRNHGLNLLAHEGLVRRVVGGQWHPVPRLQALAAANRIEAYSFPVGVIHRLFRGIADGLPGHLSRSGLSTFVDPRHGGGRLNRRTREQLVSLVRTGGDDALLFEAFPIDVALIGVGFMAGSAAVAMPRPSIAVAQAARRSGGVVIAQLNLIGTIERLPRDHAVVPDMLIDVLVAEGAAERAWETFMPPANGRTPPTRLLQ